MYNYIQTHLSMNFFILNMKGLFKYFVAYNMWKYEVIIIIRK